MTGMAKPQEPDATESTPGDEPPKPPPYAPDPRLIDVMERGPRTTAEQAREKLRRDAGVRDD